jgi:hypothetical protein
VFRKLARLLAWRYAVAIWLVLLAFIPSLLLRRFFPYPFLFLFFAAVVGSAWFEGSGPGFLAVALSTLLADF